MEFASLVHVNALVIAFRTAFREECFEPFDGGCLGYPGITMVAISEVVRDENPASFTIESSVFRGSLLVLGLGLGEGEVDG